MHRWFEEVWNRQREDAIDEMMYEDCVTHGVTDGLGNELRGPAGFKQHFRAFTAAWPDLRVTVEETVAEGDRIVARCTVTGTHTGDGIGIPPTGKAVRITGMVMARVENGKFVEGWNEFNLLSMYQQIDVLPQQLG